MRLRGGSVLLFVDESVHGGWALNICSNKHICCRKVSFLVQILAKKERKKENRQPKGGMGGRHAATTQGF